MHFLTEVLSLSKAIFVILTIIIWILYTLYDVNTVTWNQKSPDIPATYSSGVTYHRHSRNKNDEYYSSSFRSLHDQMSSSSSTDLPVSPAYDHEFQNTTIVFQSVTKIHSLQSSSVYVTRREVKSGQQ